MAKPKTSGTWTGVPGGTYTWSAGTTLPNTAYNLTAPAAAGSFVVATPTTRTKEFSVTATLAQLNNGSTFTGQAASKDSIRVSDAGVISDTIFSKFSSVESLVLKNSGNYQATLGSNAENAGIRNVESNRGNDAIDASGYSVNNGIEIESGWGDDSIKGGHGNDKLEGGRGKDWLDLGSGGADEVEYESVLDGSAVTNSGNFSGYDEITGFSNDDCVDADFSYMGVGKGWLNPADDLTSYDVVNAAISGLLAPGSTLGTDNQSYKVLFVLSNGNDSALYTATVTDTDNTIGTSSFSASDLTMLGMLNGVTDPNINIC